MAPDLCAARPPDGVFGAAVPVLRSHVVSGPETITPEEYRRLVGGGAKRDRYGSTARKTTCAFGHRHGSATEARVCHRLTMECAEFRPSWRLYQQPSFPLFSIAPDDRGRALKYTPDFAIWDGGRLVRVIEAKSPRRVSRDFPVRRRAFEATYGIAVEIVDR